MIDIHDFVKVVSRPAWGAKKAYLITRSFCSIRRDDIVLAGFPKTGTTWVRYFLYSLLRQDEKHLGESIDDMNDYIPEYAHKSLFNPWIFKQCPRIIKTHRKFQPVFSNLKAVLIIRDPRDIAISYYHYASGMKNNDFSLSLKELLRDKKTGLESFIKHFSSWEKNVGLIIRYEKLKTEPVEEYTKLASYLGITDDQKKIELAVNESTFSSMKKAQAGSTRLQNEFKTGHEFMRSGQSSQWVDKLDDQDVMYFEQLKQKYNFYLYE